MGQSEQREEALWNVRECARYLNMSVSWIYQQVEAGSIPFAKLGSRLRFHPARVRDFAASLGGASAKVIPIRGR
jgi:excisionase family DNA binding protein